MKIEKLIEDLQAIAALHPGIPVCIRNDEYAYNIQIRHMELKIDDYYDVSDKSNNMYYNKVIVILD